LAGCDLETRIAPAALDRGTLCYPSYGRTSTAILTIDTH